MRRKFGIYCIIIEELISSIKEDQTESANIFTQLEANIKTIQSDTSETKERVKTNQQPAKIRQQRVRPDHSMQRNPQHRSSTSKKKRKVLILHDSQLNSFQPDSFSQAFTTPCVDGRILVAFLYVASRRNYLRHFIAASRTRF